MATVRMKKGDKFADIFDSPETIKQAQLDGYSIIEKKAESKGEEVKAESKTDEPEKESKTRAKRQ